MRSLLVLFLVLAGFLGLLLMPEAMRERLHLTALSDVVRQTQAMVGMVPREDGIRGTVNAEDINWYQWSEGRRAGHETKDYVVIDADSRRLVNHSLSWDRPHIVIRCVDAATDFYVVWGAPIGDLWSPPELRYRFDDGPAQRADWKLSNNYQAIGLWRDSGIDFIKTLAEAKDLTIEVEIQNDPRLHQASFDIAGLEGRIAALRQNCRW